MFCGTQGIDSVIQMEIQIRIFETFKNQLLKQ